MLREIDDLVETDFVFDMDCKALHPKEPFTHKDSTEMRDILLKIYSIAHCIDCFACQQKYFWCEACDERWKDTANYSKCPKCLSVIDVRRTMSREDAEKLGLVKES
jgi:hypothetical protein